MQNHNEELYGPYEPCPILQNDFTATHVVESKSKLAALILAIERHPQITRSPMILAPRALYFVWDFLRRTELNLSQVDVPALAANNDGALESYNDVLGRISLACQIISDESGRMCRMITQNDAVDFGAEARARAKDLTEN